MIGFNGVPYGDPAFFAEQVLATVLGGGMSSRLFQEVREKRGLAYSVFAFATSYIDSGLFGIYGLSDAATHTALGLHALQHRGQEAAGIVAYDGEQFHSHRALGLVGDHFNAPAVMNRLVGHVAIGHVRFSPTGETVPRNTAPSLYSRIRITHISTPWVRMTSGKFVPSRSRSHA